MLQIDCATIRSSRLGGWAGLWSAVIDLTTRSEGGNEEVAVILRAVTKDGAESSHHAAQ
jgi:hypothetical protein